MAEHRSRVVARILIIEDDADVRSLLAAELQAAGHDVREAQDGLQGVDMHRADPADVVVTDIFMPEKEGIETIRELREEFPTLKIIAISGGGRARSGGGFAIQKIGVVAGQLGVAAVLQKPFEARELLASVDAALAAP